MKDLIYDVGMHDGADSEFYLRKGFRVVSVEADPDLCASAAERLADFVTEGRLTIVNRAIAPTSGPRTFYRASLSDWSTIVPEWRSDVATRGVAFDAIVVEGITLADLVAQYGDAFYMKLDIEGMDRAALESLATTDVRPDYVSMETTFSRAVDFDEAKADFGTLARLGYDRFKIIDQYSVPSQEPPFQPRAGAYVDHEFTSGTSGLFGEETPGDWLPLDAAFRGFKRRLRPKWLQKRLYPMPRIYSYYCSAMSRLTGKEPNLGWFDIHARHSSVG